LLADRTAETLSRRPDPASWSVTEIVCHLRDVEELFLVRFQTILAADDPQILTLGATPEALAAWSIGGEIGHPLDPDRWAEDRQYARQDATAALAAFVRRRGETIALLDGLNAAQWRRGGIHQARGRMTLDEWVASLAGHDDNHLEQLRHLDQLRQTLDGGT
ncbi:MAG TPA: DinB family protein, partial [Candidatus Bathyarchaeia archaeon]|nr:DinB family protein [Candidatus Bathyarchaeia archaeon]